MPLKTSDEREFELINILGVKLHASQRDLSRQLELSLGTTNMLIRRLAAKGYIRVSQLNKRKVKYLLTAKGFAEKMRKSVKYTLKTLHSINLIKEKLKKIILEVYTSGERNFIVLGKSDFASLIELVFKDLGFKDHHLEYIENMNGKDIQGTLFICREGIEISTKGSVRVINLMYELARDNSLIVKAEEKENYEHQYTE